MKDSESPADLRTPAEAEGEDPQALQIDLDDVDVSAEAAPPALPLGLPPLPAMPPLPPASSATPSARARSPMFYVGILVGVLVLSAAVGTVVALSRRGAPSTAASAASPTPAASRAAAPKVITIGTVEMDDNPDGGP
jgi:hypothetical protein